MTDLPSLDGRVFASDAEVEGGDVGPATIFRYRETTDGVISAAYAGGQVVTGHLVGEDGRLAMDETWEWESEPGTGTSRVVEVPA